MKLDLSTKLVALENRAGEGNVSVATNPLEPIPDCSSNDRVLIQHIDRSHPGVTPAVSAALCEAAAVCLDRHHKSPKRLAVYCNGKSNDYTFQWESSSQRARNCHAYENDATKNGAYAISLICVERSLNLVAVAEAESGTGADWYVAPLGHGLDEDGLPYLEDPEVFRLEVSGQDRGSIGHRTTVKQHQLESGKSSIPGISSVVGFERAVVRIDYLRLQEEDN